MPKARPILKDPPITYEFNPRASRRCDPKPLCLLESRGGGTHPGLSSRYDRGRPRRRREDSAKRRSHRRGHRDHGPLPPRRRDAPAPARHPRGDVRRRRLRGQRPLTTHRGARRWDGQGGAQPEVRLPVHARHLWDLALTPFRHDASRPDPGWRQLCGVLLPGSSGGALPRRVARQVRAEERLVWAVERGTARVRRAGRQGLVASARPSRGIARRGGTRTDLANRVRGCRGDSRDGTCWRQARRSSLEGAGGDSARATRPGSRPPGVLLPATRRDTTARGPRAATQPQQPQANHGCLPDPGDRSPRYEGLDPPQGGPPCGEGITRVSGTTEETWYLPRNIPWFHKSEDRPHPRELPAVPRTDRASRLYGSEYPADPARG